MSYNMPWWVFHGLSKGRSLTIVCWAKRAVGHPSSKSRRMVHGAWRMMLEVVLFHIDSVVMYSRCVSRL